MAEQRQFTLIGNFTDNITRPLESVNKTLDKTLSKLERFHTLGTVITGDFKSMAAASRDFQSSLKGQARDINQLNAALKRMSTQMGKVNRAYRAGGRRYVGQAARAGSGGGNGPRPPRGGGGGARGGGGSITGGVVAGELITNAIVSGFRLGAQIIEAPFRYFANALGERIQDETSDLKAAGGYFSISKRQDQPFVKTFDQALEFTEKNNVILAKLAAALPGETRQYVEVSKRIGDSIARVVANDVPKAIIEANKIIAKEPEFYGDKITGTGQEATQKAISVLLGDLTKKTVLAGFGDRGGAGGVTGPYGLPGLSERILSQDQVSIGQFQRYAAIFRDPQILDSLQRNIGEINSTQKNSVERLRALSKLFDEVLPPEQVEKYRRSTAGILESIRSLVLDPEVGFFGIGRKISGLGYKMNDYGQYIDKTGKVVDEANRVADENLSLFKVLRDILANFALVLTPLLEILPQIFDPIGIIAQKLKGAREFAARLLRNFEGFSKGVEAFADTLPEAQKLKLLQSKSVRASIETIAALFESLGIIDKNFRKKVTDIVKNPDAKLGGILKELGTIFFESEAAYDLGKQIGEVIGTVINLLGTSLGALTGIISTGEFAKGAKQGFNEAGGPQGIKLIIKSLFKLLFEAVRTVIETAPLETALVGGTLLLAPFLPQIITGLLSPIAGAFTGLSLGPAVTAALASPAGIAAIVAIVAALAKAIDEPAEKSYQQTTATNTKNQAAVVKNLQTGPAPGQDENTFVRDNLFKFAGTELYQAVADFGKGFIELFAGLFDFVVGLFTDPEQVADGIDKMFSGLWKLFTGIGHLLIGLLASVPAILVTLAIALKNLFLGIAKSVGRLKDRFLNWVSTWWPWGGGGSETPNKTPPKPPTRPRGAGGVNRAYGGVGTAMMRELAMAPKGSKLVIANSSETILPAGYRLGAFGGGGNTYGDIVVTVNAGSTQDPESLASLVALKISNAVNDQRSSYFV